MTFQLQDIIKQSGVTTDEMLSELYRLSDVSTIYSAEGKTVKAILIIIKPIFYKLGYEVYNDYHFSYRGDLGKDWVFSCREMDNLMRKHSFYIRDVKKCLKDREKVHTKIGDAFVTFQCDNDNPIQFLNLEEHDKKLKEECKATMVEECKKTVVELCNMSCEDRVGIFGQGYSISDILRKWTIDEIREKIDEHKALHVGDEVECIMLGGKNWRGIVCKINDEDIHLYRYRDSLIRSDDYRPVVEIYRKDGSTYKTLRKTGQHYSDFELLELINKGEA